MPGSIPYNALAPASKRALEREERAKTIFAEAEARFGKEVLPSLQGKLGTSHTLVALLTPDIHLTSHTYGTFSRWIKENHPGWKLKRREATKEEAKAHKAYSHKGGTKCFFVDAVYTVPDPQKQAKREKAAEGRAFKKQKLLEEKNRTPIYKMEGAAAFPLGELEDALQLQILAYAADVPTLNALMRTSSRLRTMVDTDAFWKPNLQFLLRELLGQSTPPSWQSTHFRSWPAATDGFLGGTLYMMEQHMHEYERDPARFTVAEACEFQWLLEDVPLKEYYKQVALLAVESHETHVESMEQADRCPYCCHKQWDCRCGRRIPQQWYDNLPRIPMFRAAGLHF